ncbi:TIGR04376 family protein [Leptolyngbya sp. FACHB-711]|uniref:TIGR04376 family protein n=1 Tax=unclassified Leptolyngbya TaxID=2650499 RepID=UPI00168A22CA|nr:TIGR04376 family protein [Leptolyngbya sp. FACHB-711]MBD1850525.1 TIGR04376 family protein [Cyanobacteria bacterium FACHB-502]MBD2027330.1 TIGR04376 family protein [Leptolyngbya sp. FACHB-711]
MGLFEDLSGFLESRLEEFLRNNPHLELQALADKLAEQEEEAIRLLGNLRLREKQLQDEILNTAQEIQRWHVRIEKAKNANRLDLVKPAEEREAALLRQGNQLWGQMELVKERVKQAIELQSQIKVRRQEIKVKLTEAEAAARATAQSEQFQTDQQWQTIGWNQGFSSNTAADPLEQSFRRWEMDEELENLKRQMGR